MSKFDTTPLPPHVRVALRDDVWCEGDALAQLARVAARPGCVAAAGMPDLHPGRGIPVGAAFAFSGVVHPDLIGSDAGCGASLTVAQAKVSSLDALERRVRAGLDEDPLAGVDAAALVAAVWARGARGLAEVEGVPAAMAALADGVREADQEDDGVAAGPGIYGDTPGGVLGTIGGGNHFAEISRVTEIRHAAHAEALGVARGDVVVLAHSGSRGLGGRLHERWAGRAAGLSGDDALVYLSELAGARRFAVANRFVITFRLLQALGAARSGKARCVVDVVHNDVSAQVRDGRSRWLHRKGAAPAAAGQPTVVLGSRGAPSWLMVGCGNDALLSSVAHGAGRRMGRGEALAKLKARYHRTELQRTSLGSRVICDDPTLLYEEHPDAYKPMDPIVETVAEFGLAEPVAALTPLLTLKV